MFVLLIGDLPVASIVVQPLTNISFGYENTCRCEPECNNGADTRKRHLCEERENQQEEDK